MAEVDEQALRAAQGRWEREEALEQQIRNDAQLLRQSDEKVSRWLDGFITDERIAQIQTSRAAIRADMDDAIAELARIRGEEPPEASDGWGVADRLVTFGDAIADASEQVSENAMNYADLEDAVADMSETVSELWEQLAG